MTEVFKSREGNDVLVLWPPSGDSMIRVRGTWEPLASWGPLSVEELDDGWVEVTDESEASSLVKEATSTGKLSTLNYYRELAEAHWGEFLPSRYTQLQEAGELEAALTRAAELTHGEMTSAMHAGVPRDQAWEAIRGHYLLLEPEPETVDEDDPNPNQAFYDLSRELHEDTMRAYAEAAGIPYEDF